MNIGDNICNIFPSSIDNTNFRYIKIDNIYSSSILITNFPRFTSFLQIIENIPKKYLYDMSIYIRKQDNMKVLKELTYYISSSSSEIKTINKNQIDIDILGQVKEDAKNLRKEIQINEQEIFSVNFLITFYNSDKKILFDKIKEFQSIIYSKGLTSNIANFRHLDSYILNLPLNRNKEKILELNERTFTTNALSNIFPFYTRTIFDKNGIIFGFTQEENKICNIDIFDNKYINSNMCVFGSSGSGKSYFIKLLVIRLFLNGKNQFVIDPEGEYINIAKKLNGNYLEISSKTPIYYFNPFEILEYEIFMYKDRVIEYKIEKITEFIIFLCNIKNENEIEGIKIAIKNVYNKFGIKKVDNVYKVSNKNKIYVEKNIINSNKFPIFEDLLNYINSKKLKYKIKENIINKFPTFTKYTNINLKNNLNIFDTSNLNIKIESFFVNQIINGIVDNLKYINKKKENNLYEKNSSVIYIDEIWKYIKNNNLFEENIHLGEKIFELFKTIRKNNASIVAITQDISDFFLLDNGNYSKSIINNSSFKIFFKLDFSDSEFLQKYYILGEEELYKINRLDKGQNLICFKNITLTLNIKANNYEKEIVEGDFNENNSSIR